MAFRYHFLRGGPARICDYLSPTACRVKIQSYQRQEDLLTSFRRWEKLLFGQIWLRLLVHQPSVFSRIHRRKPSAAEITLMCQHTNISTSSITGSVAHWRGKLTPKACCGLLAGLVALSCGRVEVWEGLMKRTAAVASYIWFTDAVNSK